MSSFTDALGQEWRIEFDGFLLDQVATEAQVDLADMSAGGLLAVEKDVKALVRVLAVVCDEQVKGQHKTAVEFQKQIRKDAITRARKAVIEALADFFPESEWSVIQSSLTTRKNQPEMTPEQLQLAAGFLKMDPDIQRDVMSLIRDETDGLGSLPSLMDIESAAGLENIPPMPASNSQENATLAPEVTPSDSSG